MVATFIWFFFFIVTVANAEVSTLAQANAQFQANCAQVGITSATCAQYCRYDVQSSEVIKIMTSQACTMTEWKALMVAASGGNNNLACCQQNAITQNCYLYCDPRHYQFPQTLLGYLPYMDCLKQFDIIKKCHIRSLG